MALLPHPNVFLPLMESRTSPHLPLGIAPGSSEAVIMGLRVFRLQYAEKDIVNAFPPASGPSMTV
jgi:hypothetical protein